MSRFFESVTLWCLAAFWSLLVCTVGLLLLLADRLKRN
jgi:hypothetical protein